MTPSVQDRGRKRLDNWAEWSRRDSPGIDYPHASPYGRLAQSGDIWEEGEDHYDAVRAEMPVDDIDAAKVEQLVMGFVGKVNRVVRAYYLSHCGIVIGAKELRIGRSEFQELLDYAAQYVGLSR